MKTKFIILVSVLTSAFVLAVSSKGLDAVGSAQLSYPEETQQYESVPVDIVANGDGYYSFMSNIEVQSGKDGITCISVENPVLLSFSVSSKHQGGVWILDLNEGKKVLNSLKDVKKELETEEKNDMAQRIDSVIQQIERSGPLTHLST